MAFPRKNGEDREPSVSHTSAPKPEKIHTDEFRNWIIQGLSDEAIGAENATNRIKAFELLGKVNGIFKDVGDETPATQPDDEFAQTLGAILGIPPRRITRALKGEHPDRK